MRAIAVLAALIATIVLATDVTTTHAPAHKVQIDQAQARYLAAHQCRLYLRGGDVYANDCLSIP